MIYVFDIDGTLCTDTGGKYEKAKPIKERIKFVNKLYDTGDTIKLFTARGMGRTQDNVLMASVLFTKLTTEQLEKWGVKYHSLHIGVKPSGDMYVDDKARSADEFFL